MKSIESPSISSRSTDCAHLIQALNECHAKGVWHKITGGCNGIKHDLNMCLRQEVSLYAKLTSLPRMLLR